MANLIGIRNMCVRSCLALSLALGDIVSFQGDSSYSASLGSYYSAQASVVHPDCIILPRKVEDVSIAIRILAAPNVSAKADPLISSRGCQFAVRSGGHTAFAGAANIAGGVTIDLSRLSSITLSVPGNILPTLSVGAGSNWGAVYEYLDPLQLSANGGRSTSVGVGGLTLGGGISYFGPRFGWTCDTVTSFEVVLADGRVVNANEDENPDLLWALRGGKNNLGIVTRVDLQTFSQGQLWGGEVVRPFDTADEQMTALAAFNEPRNYDEFASLITTFAYSGASDARVIVNNMEYTKPMADPPVFNTLTGMAALSSTQRITNMTDLTAETEANNPRGLRQASATLTIVSSVPAINATVRAWNASIAAVCHIPGIVWAVGMDPLPPLLYARHSRANALGLVDRKGASLIIVNLSIMWTNAADDDMVDKAARVLIATIRQDVGGLDALDPYLYVNYAAPWQKPIEGYGKANVDRLQRVHRMYDPEGVFATLVPGGFKIPSLG
ncbi:hypothetical protein F5Y17DRAFT_458134 [Xylariaceae sp. FL0594]|nr:hypothetical protein F5Y17DRAFT_458134 [Xylariaceae sp. FL0594]